MSKSSPRPSRLPTPSPRRLASRGAVVLYVALVGSLAAVGFAAGAGADPFVQRWSAVLTSVLAVSSLVLAGISIIQMRRLSGHVRALEGERFGLQHAYDRARLESLVDGMTGLGNHRAFQVALDDEVAAARRAKAPLALLMIDVDDLKAVNERRGQMAGDEVLGSVTQILRASMARADRAFRIGGDEFAVLRPGCDVDGATSFANDVQAAALSGNHGRSGAISLTVGVTAFPQLSADRQQMVLHADAALHAGKRMGVARVERFDPERLGIADDQRSLFELTSAVERVTEGGLLRAVYQPVHSLRTGEVVGYEGLVRVTEAAEFADPTSLFLAAEATRRTIELDVVCARTILADAAGIPASAWIAINLSPRTLASEAFSPLEVVELARRHGLTPDQLVVELTERDEIEDLPRLQAAVATLRRHGVRIAIDDVGAGHADLRLLNDLESDIMKVDMSLVRAGAEHEPSDAVLRALATIATQHGRMIVAEGIETRDMLEAVLALRFDAGQGYLLGRPAPGHDAAPVDLLGLIETTDAAA